MKNILFVLAFSFWVCACQASKPIRIFIAGDSTAQTYDTTKTLQRGWGQMLQSFFDNKVEVINRAKAGRSTKSFIDEQRWEGIMNDLKKDDWVIVQFAHNDTSTKPERHASPTDFKANLVHFINDTRAHKAKILLLTPIVMRTFNDHGNLVDDRLKNYPSIIRAVAREYNVPMIDINVKTRDLILNLGPDKSKELYMWTVPGEDPSKPNGSKDDTHTKETGAKQIAAFVAEGIKDLRLKGLYNHIVQH
ncbi:rhamnogalacturonan acetylesterase [uncultured Bacteroides sp.]|uniref:rhamnogalacturonan acetylesterase n=1 Tax=uncultured Bacteroides sp. TaxID=162156 RepID=UPI002AA8A5B7|nr:rhamnogalacturonan acetylesterase [uncultured Bacteroides sp.]